MMNKLISALERRKIVLRERITLDRTNENFIDSKDSRYKELKIVDRLLMFYERRRNDRDN